MSDRDHEQTPGELPDCPTLASEPNGPNGENRTERDPTGRFLPGNAAAKGHGGGAAQLAHWRKLTREATTEVDVLAVWGTLVACAKAGEPWAVHEFLDRTQGKVALAEPEPAEGLSELLAREYQRWLRPAEVLYGERLAALEDENARLKAAQPAAAFDRSAVDARTGALP